MIIMIRKRKAKKIIAAAALVSAAAAVIFLISVFQGREINTSAEGSWGLSFQEEGKPPVANAGMDYLKKFNSYYAENTDKKVLYLTFDAGMKTDILQISWMFLKSIMSKRHFSSSAII